MKKWLVLALLITGCTGCGGKIVVPPPEEEANEEVDSDDTTGSDGSDDDAPVGDSDPGDTVGDGEGDSDVGGDSDEPVPEITCGPGEAPICHIPPGNPEAKHMICVLGCSLGPHLMEHGDCFDTCEGCPKEE